MVRILRRWKIITIVLILVSVPIVVFSSHYIQLALMEHITLKEFLVRMVARSQDLNETSPTYGGFGTGVDVWKTVLATDILNILGRLDAIDTEALMQYVIGPNETGPIDKPITAQYKSSKIEAAYQIVHVSSLLGKLDSLPNSLMNQIREVVRTFLNYTTETYDDYTFWWYARPLLFETANLIGEGRSINITLQRADIIDNIRKELLWTGGSSIHRLWNFAKASNELLLAEYPEIPRDTKNVYLPEEVEFMLEFYVLSSWNNQHCGFNENPSTRSRFDVPDVWETYLAVDLYAMCTFGFGWGRWETDAFKCEVGSQYEGLINFVKSCQNRYGLFFWSPEQVTNDDKFELHSTFYVLSLLKEIEQLDFLEQVVRWPPQPTFLESIGIF